MASLLTDLFQSILTPGPTPTLLVATNVTFACLQTVLLLLLAATYSVHFVVLSFLSAGLWWAINWFAQELKDAQVLGEQRRQHMEEAGAEEDTETELDTVIGTGELKPSSKEVGYQGNLGDGRSENNTEDEWERVSENEKDK